MYTFIIGSITCSIYAVFDVYKRVNIYIKVNMGTYSFKYARLYYYNNVHSASVSIFPRNFLDVEINRIILLRVTIQYCLISM